MAGMAAIVLTFWSWPGWLDGKHDLIYCDLVEDCKSWRYFEIYFPMGFIGLNHNKWGIIISH
jgi:hypothetical protein